MVQEFPPQQAGRIIRDAAQPLVRGLAGLQLLGCQLVTGSRRTIGRLPAISTLTGVRRLPGSFLIGLCGGLVAIIRRRLLRTGVVRIIAGTALIASLRAVVAGPRGRLGASGTVLRELVSGLLLRPVAAVSVSGLVCSPPILIGGI